MRFAKTHVCIAVVILFLLVVDSESNGPLYDTRFANLEMTSTRQPIEKESKENKRASDTIDHKNEYSLNQKPNKKKDCGHANSNTASENDIVETYLLYHV